MAVATVLDSPSVRWRSAMRSAREGLVEGLSSIAMTPKIHTRRMRTIDSQRDAAPLRSGDAAGGGDRANHTP
jgi:hypothetical protein